MTYVQSLATAATTLIHLLFFAQGKEDEEKKQLVAQLRLLDTNVTGGLIEYLQRSKQLLSESKNGGS